MQLSNRGVSPQPSALQQVNSSLYASSRSAGRARELDATAGSTAKTIDDQLREHSAFATPCGFSLTFSLDLVIYYSVAFSLMWQFEPDWLQTSNRPASQVYGVHARSDRLDLSERSRISKIDPHGPFGQDSSGPRSFSTRGWGAPRDKVLETYSIGAQTPRVDQLSNRLITNSPRPSQIPVWVLWSPLSLRALTAVCRHRPHPNPVGTRSTILCGEGFK